MLVLEGPDRKRTIRSVSALSSPTTKRHAIGYTSLKLKGKYMEST